MHVLVWLSCVFWIVYMLTNLERDIRDLYRVFTGHDCTEFLNENNEPLVCCIPTFPACCGQAFLPGGASRTVHSSLLLSGECWWASISERQPGGCEPPNTPLIPHWSQGKGLDVQIQGFLRSVLFAFVNSLFDTLFHCPCKRKGQNIQMNSLWKILAHVGSWERHGFCCQRNFSLQPRGGDRHSDTLLSEGCSQIWGNKPPQIALLAGLFRTQKRVLKNQMYTFVRAVISWSLCSKKKGGLTFQTWPLFEPAVSQTQCTLFHYIPVG